MERPETGRKPEVSTGAAEPLPNTEYAAHSPNTVGRNPPAAGDGFRTYWLYGLYELSTSPFMHLFKIYSSTGNENYIKTCT